MSNRKNWNEEKQAEFLATTQHTYEQAHRATGRTGRMLLEAVKLASEGREVLVTAHSNEYARTLCRQTCGIIYAAFGGEALSHGGAKLRIVVGKGNITFTTREKLENPKGHRLTDLYFAVFSDHFRGNKR